jgi:Protein of unknown function (DUF2505)
MEIKGSYTYSVPVAAVIRLLSDAQATVAKYESMGHREVQILECDEKERTLRIVSSRVVDVDLPGFAKRVLKPTNTMRQTDDWRRRDDGSWDGTFDVEVRGAPIRISGTMRLAPLNGRAVHDVCVRVEVKVPIVGGRIADWAAKGDVRRNVDGEFAFNDAWLHQHV